MYISGTTGISLVVPICFVSSLFCSFFIRRKLPPESIHMRKPEVSVELVPYKGGYVIRHVSHRVTKAGYDPVAEFVGIDGYWTRDPSAVSLFKSERIGNIHLKKYLPQD